MICEDCKYADLPNWEEPCISCLHAEGSWSKFEKFEYEKSCLTCHYAYTDNAEYCNDCYSHSFWKEHVDGVEIGAKVMQETIKHDKADEINSPSHYNMGEIEVIDYIVDKLDNPEDYCIGNVLKYVSRYKHKGVPVQDLKKARWYLNKAIELRECNKIKEVK